jgi:soluble lytic murein transglycosylase-like protein
VIGVESAYDARAVSKRGAAGLMQLMPPTAARFGVTDPFDPVQNIRGGTQYLQELLRRFGNDVELALAAYNAGEAAVERYGRKVPPYPETIAYVPRVLRAYVQGAAGR